MHDDTYNKKSRQKATFISKYKGQTRVWPLSLPIMFVITTILITLSQLMMIVVTIIAQAPEKSACFEDTISFP